MAVGSFQLLLGQIKTSPEVIKIPAIQILFDILMVHEGAFLGKRDATVGCSFCVGRVDSHDS
jgi:condensin complex subunit 3